MIITIFNVVLLIALALILARILGFIFDKFKQPAVIGEIFAGILLGGLGVFLFHGEEIVFGPIRFFLPDLNYTDPEFTLLAEFGILFLLFVSGLGTNLKQMKKMEKSSSYVAIGGVLLPFVFGTCAGYLLDFSLQESIIFGLILIATSVGVTVRSFLDLHVLDTDVGATVLGAAVIDDVIGIVLLVFVINIGDPLSIGFLGVKIFLFFLVFLYIGLRVMDRVLDLGDRIHLPKAFLSFSLAIFLLYSFFAYASGIEGIIGALVAGLLIGNTLKSRKILDDVEAISYGLFVPLFFVWVGAQLFMGASDDPSTYAMIGLLAGVLIVVGIVGKIIGCGLGARLAGMTGRESLQVGVGMIPRMELALIIASAALSRGVFDDVVGHQILAATLLLAIVTTVLTPFLIKAVFKPT